MKYAPDQPRGPDRKFGTTGGTDKKPTMKELFSQRLGIARGDMPPIRSGVKENFVAEPRAAVALHVNLDKSLALN